MAYDLEKEKREAIDAGNRALKSLRNAQDNLNSAKNWGLWDMFGGGFISTMAKHSKMDRAKQNMEQARCDFLSFADWFFDGFVVDWMVQDRINQASRQVAEAIRRVEGILRQL